MFSSAGSLVFWVAGGMATLCLTGFWIGVVIANFKQRRYLKLDKE
jgi:hypothetical protein